jgi:hypothetical protein
VRLQFLTVAFEVLKVLFGVSIVVYEVRRFVLEVLTFVNSCGHVSNICVCEFAYVSVEVLIHSSAGIPHTPDHFESTTLTSVKAP